MLDFKKIDKITSKYEDIDDKKMKSKSILRGKSYLDLSDVVTYKPEKVDRYFIRKGYYNNEDSKNRPHT